MFVSPKVSAGSKAFAQGLRDGDVLLKINSSLTHNLEHTEAMKLIKTAKDGLNLTLTRYNFYAVVLLMHDDKVLCILICLLSGSHHQLCYQ